MEHILEQLDSLIVYCLNNGMAGDQNFIALVTALKTNIILKGQDIEKLSKIFANEIEEYENEKISGFTRPRHDTLDMEHFRFVGDDQ